MDACGCYQGQTGWSAKDKQCLPNEDTCDAEAQCCGAAMLPTLDLNGQAICVQVSCADLNTPENCNVKVGCGWNSVDNACETKATCCSYFELPQKRVQQASQIGGKFGTL